MFLYELNFKVLGIRKNILCRNNFIKKEKRNKLNLIINLNKRAKTNIRYKLKIHNKNYQSIVKQTNVCFLTGRNRSIFNEGRLKRQVFKRAVMNNEISFLKKK